MRRQAHGASLHGMSDERDSQQARIREAAIECLLAGAFFGALFGALGQAIGGFEGGFLVCVIIFALAMTIGGVIRFRKVRKPK